MRAIFWGLARIDTALRTGMSSPVSGQALLIHVPDGRIDPVLQPNAIVGGLELRLQGDLGSLSGQDKDVQLWDSHTRRHENRCRKQISRA